MKTERGALWLSCLSAALMAVLALAFAFATHSRAIMLEGVYNLIYFTAGLATIRVARVALKPDTPQFPFGHAYFESLINAGKGVMILGISALALVGSAIAVLSGGRAIDAGLAIVYAIAATLLCSTTATVLHRSKQTLDSPLVRADAENWILDAAISGAILVAFCVAALLASLGYAAAARYVDPILVAVVVIAFLGMPVRLSRDALMELLNRSPGAAIAQPVTAAIDGVLERVPVAERYVRMVRPGRTLYVVVHVVLRESESIPTLRNLDDLRGEIDQAVRLAHGRAVIDTVFTADPRWALPSSGASAPHAPVGGHPGND